MSVPIQSLALLAILAGSSAQNPTGRPSAQDEKEAAALLELIAELDEIGASQAIVPEQLQPGRPEPLPWSQSFCPVHFGRLLPGEAEVVYGLLDFRSPAYPRARDAQFPHSNISTPGGCVVNPNRSARPTNYCPDCRIAELTWTANHPR